MRDRTCHFPPCHTPAVSCDLDHTVAVADGGLTVTVNLGPGCGHDHHLKHAGGWHIEQTSPGHFVWTSRSGARHTSVTPPIIPTLPDPDPGLERHRSSTEPDQYAGYDPVWPDRPHLSVGLTGPLRDGPIPPPTGQTPPERQPPPPDRAPPPIDPDDPRPPPF